MSAYTPPALNAVDFALTAHTVPSIASPTQVLSPYSVPTLTAVNFSLIAYTQPTYQNIGWELLPGGGVTITGTLAATDSADTAAFSGDLVHVGTLAVTEGADTAVLAGQVGHVGTLAATDGADTAALSGKLCHAGMLAATDGADTFAAIGTVTSDEETITVAPRYTGLGYFVDDGRKRETITLYDEEAEIFELLATIMPVIHEQQRRATT